MSDKVESVGVRDETEKLTLWMEVKIKKLWGIDTRRSPPATSPPPPRRLVASCSQTLHNYVTNEFVDSETVLITSL